MTKHHSSTHGAAPRDAKQEAARLEAMAESSPFFDLTHPIDGYELTKLIVMFPVAVIRFLLVIASILCGWAVMRVLLLGHNPQQPMHPARRFFVERCIKATARTLLFCIGYYQITIKGWENVRLAEEARSVLVFNHESYVDAALMAALFAPTGVAKAGVAAIPLIRRFAVGLQAIFVQRRGTRDTANRFVSDQDPVVAIRERAADPRYALVALAPEATTKGRPCLLKFRRGAFAVGRPVTPILITFPCKHFYPGWGICDTPLHVYRLLAQLVNRVEVEVLPPVRPTPSDREVPDLFGERVRRLMADRMGVPLVDQGLTWAELMEKGMRPNWRGTEVIVPSQG